MIRGASRGFMHSLLGPFSIIVATIISIIYFQNTKDVIISLLIGLIGPLLLHLLLKFLLRAWANATNTNIKPNSLSRLGGALLTLAWGWIFICLILIFLTILPPWGKTMTIIHHDITGSASYGQIAQPLEKIFYAGPKQTTLSTKDADANINPQSLADDPRFQKVLKDPDVQKAIDAHDLGKLMSNPKIMALTQQIMTDPETLKKVMAIYKTSH